MIREHRKQGGFTLIETMVSLVVISLLAVSGSSILISTLQGSRQVSEVTQSVTDLQIAHALMRDDCAQTVERLTSAPEGLDPPTFFEGNNGSQGDFLLRFTRGGWTNPAGMEDRGDLQRVEYVLRDGALVRRSWLRPDAVRTTPVLERVILDGIEEIGLRYRSGNTWSEDWYAAEGSTRSLPEMVEITIRFGEGDTLTTFLIVGGGS